jgi:flagellar motor switch protein FliG
MPAPLLESAEATTPTGGGRLSKIQKLAALLVMLGPDSAAQILKTLDAREIEAVSKEMAHFTLISQEQQMEILEEFSDVAVEASTAVAAGAEFTRTALEKAVGSAKASDILGRVAPNRAPSGAMQGVAEMEARHIFNLIRHEQIQTIAFLMSYLAPEKAGQVFALLPPEQAEQVIERLATLAPTPVEVMERVVGVLNTKLGIKQTRVLTQTGGINNAADILNSMDKTVSKTLLAAIENRNADLCLAIRKKMFTFEDLGALDSTAIQRIMRETDMRDLALSLKKSSETLKKLLLSNISRRAAETVEEEIAFMGHIKQRDIEAAQLRVIDVVRKLESEGELDLDEAREGQYEMA